jgi:hypothetical protein
MPLLQGLPHESVAQYFMINLIPQVAATAAAWVIVSPGRCWPRPVSPCQYWRFVQQSLGLPNTHAAVALSCGIRIKIFIATLVLVLSHSTARSSDAFIVAHPVNEETKAVSVANFDDVVNYNSSTHQFILSKKGHDQVIAALKKGWISYVCLKAERLYPVQLVSITSSALFDGLVITPIVDRAGETVFQIDLGYPTVHQYKGTDDPRREKRLMNHLQSIGKLRH